MNVSGLDVIARGADFQHAASRFELRPWQWQFLHALDGRTDLRDVASRCGVELTAATTFIEESEAIGLVHVVAMSYDEYCRWSGSPQPARYEPLLAAQTAYAETSFGVAPARDDDFPASDVLGAYATTVPEWMVETPVQHDEAVSETRHEESVAETHDEEPVAETYHEEPVAESHHEEPIAETHHEEPVAETHHEEPVAETHHEAPIAETHDEEPDAETHAEPQTERHVAPQTFATPGIFSSNGHHKDTAWDPLPIAAAAGKQPTPAASPFDDMAGVSISLGAFEPEPEPESQRGSVSFSLSPDDDTWAKEPAVTHEAVAVAPHGDAASGAHEHGMIPQPVTAMQAHEPTNGHVTNGAVDAAANGPAAINSTADGNGSSVTGDLVGNLIARALTFRIK